jgi:hypothetical protein
LRFPAILSGLTTIGVFILSKALCPTEWDFYDSFNAHLISGVATRNVVTDFYIAFPLLPTIFIFLQKNWGSIPWLGFTYSLMLFIANATLAFMIFYLIYIKFPKLSVPKALLLLFPLFFIIQSFGIYKLSMTGLSFLLCGSSILLIEMLLSKNRSLVAKSAITSIIGLFFLFGICTRFDSAIAVLIITSIYILLNSQNIKRSFWSVLPLFIITAFIALLSLLKLDKTPFMKANEVQLVYLSDGDNDNGFYNELSGKDIIKYKAVNRFFLVDSLQINTALIGYLTELKIKSENKIGVNVFTRLKSSWQIAQPTIVANWQYAVLNMFILLLALATGVNRWRIVVFQTAFWLMIFSIAYIARIEDRHYAFMSQIFSYCNVLLLLNATERRKLSGKIIIVSILFISPIFPVIAFEMYSNATHVRLKQFHLSMAEKELNEIGLNKFVLLDGSSKNVFNAPPLVIRKFDKISKIVYYDMGHLALLPEYNNYLNKLCACNSRSIVDFYSFLAANKSSVLIVSTDERQEFIRQYLEVIYNKKLTVVRKEGDFSISKVNVDNDKLFYYSISSFY